MLLSMTEGLPLNCCQWLKIPIGVASTAAGVTSQLRCCLIIDDLIAKGPLIVVTDLYQRCLCCYHCAIAAVFSTCLISRRYLSGVRVLLMIC